MENLLKELQVRESRGEDVLVELENFVESNPKSEEGWLLLGKLYRKREQWGDAINAYGRAEEINPDGSAAVAKEFIYNILGYRDSDLLNP